MIEFDLAIIPTEFTMVRYFERDLKPSIKAKIDQDATYLDNYEELVVKTGKAEVKVSLRLSFYIQKTN